MNRIYKTIWNKALSRMVVTSETAKSHVTSSTSDHKGQSDFSALSFLLNPLTLALAGVLASGQALAITCTDGAGANSTICGVNNTASGNKGSAVGYNNTASGVNSPNNFATSTTSNAFGSDNTASGNNRSNAFGSENTASGEYSNAFGHLNLASGYYSSAVGLDNKATNYFSTASGVSSVASGYNSAAHGTYTAALGYGSTAVGAAGNGNFLSNQYDTQGKLVAINGVPVTVNGSGIITAINGIEVTPEQASQFAGAVAKGSAAALGNRSTALGARNIAAAEYSNAVGYYNTAIGYNSVAFGANNTANGSENVAMGLGNVTTGSISTAVGTANQTTGTGAAAIGYQNQATGSSNAFGYYNTANATYGQSNAYGIRNTASGNYSNAYGSNNVSAGSRSFAGGSYNLSMGQASTALGASTGVYSVNAPYDAGNTKLVSLNGIPLTASSQLFSSITAINGVNITTTQFDQIFEALRYGGSVAFGTNSITLGSQNFAAGNKSITVGFNNSTGGLNSAVFGVDSIALADNSVALGYDSVADRANTISVGRSGAEKQITNVKAATQDTDAVNLFQIKQVATALGGGAGFSNGVFTPPSYNIQGSSYSDVGSALSAVNTKLFSLQSQVDDLESGSGSSLMSAAEESPVAVTTQVATTDNTAKTEDAATAATVQPAVKSTASVVTATPKDGIILNPVGTGDVLTDAKAYSNEQRQAAVKSANAYTDTRVEALNSKLDNFQQGVDRRFNSQEKKINQTGAISSAFTGMAMNSAGLSGKNRVAVGFGGQGSETAVAIGYQVTPTPNTSVSIGGALSDSTKAVSAGMGFSW